MKYNYRVVRIDWKYRIQFNRLMSKKRWTTDSKRVMHPQSRILLQVFNCKEDAINTARSLYLQERIRESYNDNEIECIVIEYRDCH